MSAIVQYIIVFVILAAIIGWLIYKLFINKSKSAGCCGCDLADKCKKKEMIETRHVEPKSCSECPQKEDCDSRDDVGCA